MRFGMFVPQGWRHDLVGIEPAHHWQTMLSIARLAEAGPWESIWVYDHFHTVPVPSEQATHEAWTLMAAFAAATSRVRLGQMCSCMAYRNPMYLAKVAATVDAISGGRTEMGIGGGWYEHEWRAYGYGFPSAGTRLAMLDEGVQIMRAAWSDAQAAVSFTGQHYQVDGAICRPAPLQLGADGHTAIPLWIAGGGERKTLRTAAKYAQYTNFDGTPEGFRHKSAILADHCRDVGTDFDTIVRSANYNVVIGRDDAEVEARLAAIESHLGPHLPAVKLEEAMQMFRTGPAVGTPERIVETLRGLEGDGMTYAITYFQEAAHDTSGIELFAAEVIPALAG
ncbi:MAG: LLM class F420-dependent oxidoreductase [Kineosporiaceae bacterium]